jgi:prepilin-type N-terminal cleavage/methylation domain-containing protein
MRKAFSLVELMIVVAVLGILAAVAVPRFRSYAIEAKSSAAKSNLRVLRSAIELYTTRHGGVPPGYEDDDIDASPTSETFRRQTTLDEDLLRKVPENPFNGLETIYVVPNQSAFPGAATGGFGWVYQPVTMTIRLDWPGLDLDGISYYEY